MNAAMLTPVLEIGGTHVLSALVELPSGEMILGPKVPLNSSGTAEEIIATLTEAGRALSEIRSPETVSKAWGVAVPGPFDYEQGIGRFEGVAKFEALRDLNLRDALVEQFPGNTFWFLNDADAFGIGEAAVGAARGVGRAVAIGIGTGIGSCYLIDGVAQVEGPGVPPKAEAHLLEVDGVPLEDRCSARALRRLYENAAGTKLEVKEIADLALAGDLTAKGVFEESYGALVRALAPGLAEFGTEVLVVGGAIARSWALIDQYLAAPLVKLIPTITVRPAAFAENHAALVGAALLANTSASE